MNTSAMPLPHPQISSLKLAVYNSNNQQHQYRDNRNSNNSIRRHPEHRGMGRQPRNHMLFQKTHITPVQKHGTDIDANQRTGPDM
jgi:hypothetical protein